MPQEHKFIYRKYFGERLAGPGVRTKLEGG